MRNVQVAVTVLMCAPIGVYELIDEKSTFILIEECISCSACETACPENAIELIE